MIAWRVRLGVVRPDIARPALAAIITAAVLVGCGSPQPTLQPVPPSAPSASAPASAIASTTPTLAPTLTPTPTPPPTPAPTATPTHSTVANRIVIARLKIDLPVVEDTGSAAPSGKVAHVRSTGWPGGGTNIYLYGDAKKGSLANLWKAKVGDTIDLHLVDGSVTTYVVTKILPKVPTDTRGDKYLLRTPAEQLTLQTAAAGWKRPGDPNFIVIAVPR